MSRTRMHAFAWVGSGRVNDADHLAYARESLAAQASGKSVQSLCGVVVQPVKTIRSVGVDDGRHRCGRCPTRAAAIVGENA